MMRFRRNSCRPLIWCAVVGYALVISGVPLTGVAVPADSSGAAAKRLAAKDRSVPFPCMDRPCGCVTAKQCFTTCCCHTPAETLAWAEANRVSVDVLQALRRRVAEPEEPTASCCAVATAATAPCDDDGDYFDVCFEYEHLSAAGTADEQRPTVAGSEAPPAAPEVAPISRQTVVLKALLACGGVVSQWLAVGTCLLAVGVVPVACGQPLPERFVGSSVRDCGERAEPAAPPPRLG